MSLKFPSADELHEWKQWVITFVLLAVTVIGGSKFLWFELHH